MAEPVVVSIDQGYRSAGNPASYAPGELQQAQACWYKPGDLLQLWQQLGPTTFGDLGTGAVKGVSVLSYDNGTELVISYFSNELYSATAGLTGSFSAIITGLNASATRQSVIHHRGAWYWCNGYDRNRVLESGNPPTVIFQGLLAPVEAPVATISTAAPTAPTLPATQSGDFTNPTFATDSDDATFAHAARSSSGTNQHTWSAWPSSGTGAGRTLFAKIRLLVDRPTIPVSGGFGATGLVGTFFTILVLVEKSENSGSSWTPIFYLPTGSYSEMPEAIWIQSPISTGVNNNAVQLRVTFTYTSTSLVQVALRVFTIRIDLGPSSSARTTQNLGVYYAFMEYDATRNHRSVPGPILGPVVLTGATRVTLTLPSAARNTRTTDYIVCRTTDTDTTLVGAVEELGEIGYVPVGAAATGFVDNLDDPDINTVALPLVPMVTITDRSGEIRVPRDSAPPAFKFMGSFKGRLLGLSRENPRALFGSMPLHPHSWPAVNLIDAFPFPENDELVAGVEIGDGYLLGASGLMIHLSAPPTNVGGESFSQAEARPLKGQPGLTSQYGITAYSVAGEDRVAWVSNSGILMTNGVEAAPLTRDLDWPAEVTVSRLSSAVLRWDQRRQVLVFNADTNNDGVNDAEWLLHMAPEHQKPNGQPKITKTTSKGRTDYAFGEVASTPRLYSGDPANGQVYVEETGVGDTSYAWKTGRVYVKNNYHRINRINFRHTNWGVGRTGVLSWKVGFDDSGDTDTVSATASLANSEGEALMIGRMAEWSEVSFATTKTGGGACYDIRVNAYMMGRAGAAT